MSICWNGTNAFIIVFTLLFPSNITYSCLFLSHFHTWIFFLAFLYPALIQLTMLQHTKRNPNCRYCGNCTREYTRRSLWLTLKKCKAVGKRCTGMKHTCNCYVEYGYIRFCCNWRALTCCEQWMENRTFDYSLWAIVRTCI